MVKNSVGNPEEKVLPSPRLRLGLILSRAANRHFRASVQKYRPTTSNLLKWFLFIYAVKVITVFNLLRILKAFLHLIKFRKRL